MDNKVYKYMYKYLIILVILVALIIYTISAKYDILTQTGLQTKNNILQSSGDNMIAIADELELTEIRHMNMVYPLNNMYKVGEEKANLFSLSYVEQNLKEGQKLIAKKNQKTEDGKTYASDQIYIIFRESYPNVSLESMGLETEEEAYQAMQLAIWEVASRTGEAMYGSELSKVDSIRADLGEKNINAKVFDKAKQLVRLSETVIESQKKEGLNVVSTLVVNTESMKSSLIDIDDGSNDQMVGPYKYRVEAGIITDVKIILTDTKTGTEVGTIVDNKGEKITDYKDIDEFYVRIPDDYVGRLEVKVQTEVKRNVPVIYMADNNDYIADCYIFNHMEQTVYINVN